MHEPIYHKFLNYIEYNDLVHDLLLMLKYANYPPAPQSVSLLTLRMSLTLRKLSNLIRKRKPLKVSDFKTKLNINYKDLLIPDIKHLLMQ